MKKSVNISQLVYLAVAMGLIATCVVTYPKTSVTNKIAFPSPTLARLNTFTEVRVIRVIDGDTIEIEGNMKVRYIGIDTPETKHPSKGVECFGREAYQKNKSLVEGKIVRLKKDISDTDKYGRLLRYVWLVDKTASTSTELFINEYLVREGYAQPATFPPDVSYEDTFVIAARDAREMNKGLWNSCVKDRRKK